MKDYPKGWKPPKKKYHKAPTPPPGQVHGGKDEYKRSRDRELEQELIEEGLEDLNDVVDCPNCGETMLAREYPDHVCIDYEELEEVFEDYMDYRSHKKDSDGN